MNFYSGVDRNLEPESSLVLLRAMFEIFVLTLSQKLLRFVLDQNNLFVNHQVQCDIFYIFRFFKYSGRKYLCWNYVSCYRRKCVNAPWRNKSTERHTISSDQVKVFSRKLVRPILPAALWLRKRCCILPCMYASHGKWDMVTPWKDEVFITKAFQSWKKALYIEKNTAGVFEKHSQGDINQL